MELLFSRGRDFADIAVDANNSVAGVLLYRSVSDNADHRTLPNRSQLLDIFLYISGRSSRRWRNVPRSDASTRADFDDRGVALCHDDGHGLRKRPRLASRVRERDAGAPDYRRGTASSDQ